MVHNGENGVSDSTSGFNGMSKKLMEGMARHHRDTFAPNPDSPKDEDSNLLKPTMKKS